MNNTAAQPPQSVPNQDTETNNNYVDAYMPPGSGGQTSSDSMNQTTAPAAPQATTDPAPVSDPATSQHSQPDQTASTQSESLEDQNIFFLLGVRDGSDEQREKFLDELQQVIWEDFLEYDVKLLITSDEMAELQKLLDSQTDRDLEKQEKIIVYLEKLIPDLEEIMLEKALELKEEMVRERLSGLRQYYADKQEKLGRLDEAEQLLDSGKWYSAAHLMNSLAHS